MATRTAKLRVEIDGEKQYKQAISELNKGNAVLASEMKKLSAEYAGNEKSMEALTAKGDLLQRQLQQQKDKVETLRKAVADSAQKYGEADKRTQDWIIQLNNAEAQQFKLEHAIDETNQELDNQGKEMTGLGDTLDTIGQKLGIQLPKQAKDALNGIQGLSAGSLAAFTAIAAGVTVAVEAIKKLHQVTLEAAASADNLLTESMISGIDTGTLQKLQYAADFVDVSVSTIQGSLSKLTRVMYDAFQGSESAAEKFESLGVSITDSFGNLRDSEDVFMDVIDALGQVENLTERDAIAMELFGKSAQDLNPLIIAGSEALAEYGKQAEELSYVLTDEELQALAAVDDQVHKNEKSFETLQNRVAVQFAPASKEAMEMFGKAIDAATKTLVDSNLIGNLAQMLTSMLGIIDAVGSFVDTIPGWLNPIQNLSNQFKILAVIAATVADAMTVLAGLMPWNWGSGMIKQGLGMGDTESYTQRVMNHGRSTSGTILNAYNASGNDNWRGGLTWVGEAGPELVALPRGSTIYNAQDARSMGGSTFYVTIDAHNVQDFNDVVALAESARVRGRMR